MTAKKTKKSAKTKKSPKAKKPELIQPAVLIKEPRAPKFHGRSTGQQPKPKRWSWRLSGEQWFAVVALLILVATTVYWSLLGARSNAANSDQLVDSYLFSDWHTFSGAHFPATHTFFLKWPLFMLGAVLGNGTGVLQGLTIGVVLLTVLGLAWLTWRIIGRLVPWAMLLLTMSVALLLVPIQASAFVLLPVNMAMLTTRNIEYMVYLLAFVILLRTRQLRSWTTLVAAGTFGVLFVSDRLFLPLALGSVLFIWLLGWWRHRKELVHTGRIGLVVVMTGFLISVAMLAAFGGMTHFTHADTASPYELAGPKDMLLGLVYAGMHLLTNIGTNPAPGTLVLRDWPSAVAHNLLGVPGIAYIAMVVTGIALVTLALKSTWKHRAAIAKAPFDWPQQLTLLLLGSSAVAGLSFVMTKHYYAGDARYLGIVFFTAVVLAATLLRNVHISRRWARDWTAVAGVALVSAVYVCYLGYSDIRSAQTTLQSQSDAVVQVLSQRPVGKLVGDYWRVLPIRAASGNSQAVVPMQTCTQPREVLTSDAWQLRPKESFAYLLTLEKGQTDFPACSFEQVAKHFGKPNGSVIISGSATQPKELLLFYDHGVQRHGKQRTATLATLGPVDLSNLSPGNCPDGSVMQVVAHPDDDLLFMNPALSDSIAAGKCVRTVYLTAGDAGAGAYYWLGRMLGAESAYDTMLQNMRGWQFQSVRLNGGQNVTVSVPRGNDRISLIFLNLPDGNQHGQGFAATQYQGLAKLLEGSNAKLRGVNGSSYSREDIMSTLRQLMDTFQPTELRSTAPNITAYYADHSDHSATGSFLLAALEGYQPSWAPQLPVAQYVGYPIHGAPANVAGDALQRKEQTFLAYGKHDSGVCKTLEECYENSVYGIYLSRQYTLEEYQAAIGQ